MMCPTNKISAIIQAQWMSHSAVLCFSMSSSVLDGDLTLVFARLVMTVQTHPIGIQIAESKLCVLAKD